MNNPALSVVPATISNVETQSQETWNDARSIEQLRTFVESRLDLCDDTEDSDLF